MAVGSEGVGVGSGSRATVGVMSAANRFIALAIERCLAGPILRGSSTVTAQPSKLLLNHPVRVPEQTVTHETLRSGSFRSRLRRLAHGRAFRNDGRSITFAC